MRRKPGASFYVSIGVILLVGLFVTMFVVSNKGPLALAGAGTTTTNRSSVAALPQQDSDLDSPLGTPEALRIEEPQVLQAPDATITGTPPPTPGFQSIDGTHETTISVTIVSEPVTIMPEQEPPPTFTPLPELSSVDDGTFAAQSVRFSESPRLFNALGGQAIDAKDGTISPDSVHLAFGASPGKWGFYAATRHLFVADMLTDSVVDLGNGYFPVWSPSGSRIVYRSWNAETEQPTLRVVDMKSLESKEIFVLPKDGSRTMPVWLSEDEVLLFVGPQDTGSLTAIDVNNGELSYVIAETVKQVQEARGLSGTPHRIASFPSKGLIAVGAVDGLFVMRVRDNGVPELINELPGLSTGRPIFSPTGGQIAYIATITDQLRIVSVEGGNKEFVELPVWDPPQVVWAPDGKSLLFIYVEQGREAVRTFIVNASGSGLREVNDSAPYPYELQWTNNNQVAFLAEKGIQIYEVEK